MSGSVRVLDESGARFGFMTRKEADEQVLLGLARRESDRCIRLLPPNPRISGEQLCGRLSVKQSGRYGPLTVQVE